MLVSHRMSERFVKRELAERSRAGVAGQPRLRDRFLDDYVSYGMSRFFSLQRHAFVLVLIAARCWRSGAGCKSCSFLKTAALLLLAALAYCGGGLALGLAWLGRRGRSNVPETHSKWTPHELANFMGAIVAGGISAPVVLFSWSLARISAASASLLLSFEGLQTAAFAAVLFREDVAPPDGGDNYHDRCWWRLYPGRRRSCISAGSCNWRVPGVRALGGSTINLTRAISHRDALGIAALKCLIAGSTNAAIALGRLHHDLLVSARSALGGLTLGALAYRPQPGAVRPRACASRQRPNRGAFRDSALHPRPASRMLLGEPLTPALVAAIILTALSTWIPESHEHTHAHEVFEHEHTHVHDEHHQHAHSGDEGAQPHRHLHKHEAEDSQSSAPAGSASSPWTPLAGLHPATPEPEG